LPLHFYRSALYGRQYVAWWETRNLRMVANIRVAFGNHPGARVLNIVGSKFVGWLEFFQKRNAQKYAVTGANHVDESTYVKIGGIDERFRRGQCTLAAV
jgi:hypothetical protein